MPDGVFDLAVGRGIAVGVNNVTERLPTDYRLVVGGKVLAEEVRIKLIKDWADYVFQPDYRLATLPEVATYVRYQHLPDMPSSSGNVSHGHQSQQDEGKTPQEENREQALYHSTAQDH
ncbi:MAG: hypothetical protein MRJ92_01855 [Nitrospira sp.]|nr:hypothetical protein [Nitrospira sp.]